MLSLGIETFQVLSFGSSFLEEGGALGFCGLEIGLSLDDCDSGEFFCPLSVRLGIRFGLVDDLNHLSLDFVLHNIFFSEHFCLENLCSLLSLNTGDFRLSVGLNLLLLSFNCCSFSLSLKFLKLPFIVFS